MTLNQCLYERDWLLPALWKFAEFPWQDEHLNKQPSLKYSYIIIFTSFNYWIMLKEICVQLVEIIHVAIQEFRKLIFFALVLYWRRQSRCLLSYSNFFPFMNKMSDLIIDSSSDSATPVTLSKARTAVRVSFMLKGTRFRSSWSIKSVCNHLL